MQKPEQKSIFRYSLLRIVVAMFIFELLLASFAFLLLMLPILQNHSKDFAALILNRQISPENKFSLQTEAPEDGGPSWLPFNLILANDLQQFTGQSTEIRKVANEPNQYWLKLQAINKPYLVFNQQKVVGANAMQAIVAWFTLAIVSGLMIATWLARGLSKPIIKWRHLLQDHTNTSPYESLPLLGITELDQLQLEFVAQTNKLALAIEDRTTLLMGLSHELGAPVARLTMALELYGKQIEADKRREMELDLDEMRRIIEQFLYAAHCLCPLEQDQYSLTSLMIKLKQHYAGYAHMQFSMPAEDVKYAINITALERVLINLIDNAQRHASDTIISVQAEQHPKNLILTVTDNGPGIAEADITRLFQAFRKRSASPGVGLGLALSRLIAEQNGWTLALINRVTGGIQATVRIPINFMHNISTLKQS